mmetsp:Transcript_0/g.2  ORF Transcript_0/g.2 Transcript_0/m.2 type:complete len:95 (+) Transcript_0:257-541(+)
MTGRQLVVRLSSSLAHGQIVIRLVLAVGRVHHGSAASKVATPRGHRRVRPLPAAGGVRVDQVARRRTAAQRGEFVRWPPLVESASHRATRRGAT